MSDRLQSVHAPESFLRSLLGSQDMLELAKTAVQHLQSMGCQWVQLSWNTELGNENAEQSYPP